MCPNHVPAMSPPCVQIMRPPCVQIKNPQHQDSIVLLPLLGILWWLGHVPCLPCRFEGALREWSGFASAAAFPAGVGSRCRVCRAGQASPLPRCSLSLIGPRFSEPPPTPFCAHANRAAVATTVSPALAPADAFPPHAPRPLPPDNSRRPLPRFEHTGLLIATVSSLTQCARPRGLRCTLNLGPRLVMFRG